MPPRRRRCARLLALLAAVLGAAGDALAQEPGAEAPAIVPTNQTAATRRYDLNALPADSRSMRYPRLIAEM